MEVNQKDLQDFSQNYNKHSHFKVSANAISRHNFKTIVINNKFINDHNEVFKKIIDIEVKSTDQAESGRCWMFAYLNMIRLKMIKKYNLAPDFELSQTYLFFYDKLEKSNYFLNYILNNLNEKPDSRKTLHFLREPISDGGTTNMMFNLIKKYGLLPKSNMKETFQSKSSSSINILINQRLRHAVNDLYENKKNRNKKFIKTVLADIYTMLVIFLGEPPLQFDWEYYSKGDASKKSKKSKKGGENLRNDINMRMLKNDKSKKSMGKKKDGSKNKYNIIKNLTPQIFYTKYSTFDVDEMITLINYPGKPYNKLYNVETSNNMVNGKENNYINVSVDLLKILTKISIDDDCAVWFACDVGKYMSKNLGVLDRKAFNIKETIGFDYEMSKEDMLKYRVSEPSHAMIFKGYTMNNLEVKGKDIKLDVNKWLVENSWGDMTEKHGNFTMSDKWYTEFVYEIMINKKYLSKKLLNVLKTKATVLPMWDPFGSLLN